MARHKLLFLSVLTPLHNGAGTGLGLIDNPVIRERHTNLPYVQGTSIKGVLRDHYGNDKDTNVLALFGSPPRSPDPHEGSVVFSDAQLFAFPVRALKGGFVWATSPLLLQRLWRFITLAGLDKKRFPKLGTLIDKITSFNNLTSHAKVCPSGKALLEVDGRIILEEYPKIPAECPELSDFAREIAPSLFPVSDKFLKEEFGKKLIILTDDSFRHFVTNATEVTPNICIGDNGTTETGSLRYTEYLPTETICYSFITLLEPKLPAEQKWKEQVKALKIIRSGKELSWAEGPEWTDALFMDGFPDPPIIQLGGDATIGKGVVRLKLIWGES